MSEIKSKELEEIKVKIEIIKRYDGDIVLNIKNDNPTGLLLEYKPFHSTTPTGHDLGEFRIMEDSKLVQIMRGFAVPVIDDIDWDMEAIYPCETCESRLKWIARLQLELSALKHKNNRLKGVRDLVLSLIRNGR